MPILKPSYRIYPAIGIARLGPSNEFFLGPEFPNPDFVPTAPPDHPWAGGGGIYRDKNGNIRRQAARFRVYKVTERTVRGGKVPIKAKEITADDGVTLKWTVKIANVKAFAANPPPPFDEIDQHGNRGLHHSRIANTKTAEISGRNQARKTLVGDARFPGTTTPVGLLLLEILTDAKGRLIILAGIGNSTHAPGAGFDPDNLHNPKWFDDVCDGSVECEINGEAADRSWIVTGVPAYAQQIGHLVSLYDVAEAIAIEKRKWPREPELSVTRHVYPVLRKADLQQWVTKRARQSHRIRIELAGVERDLSPFATNERLRKPDDALPEADHRAFREEIGTNLRNPITVQRSGKKNVFLPHWYPRDSHGRVLNDYDAALVAATEAPQPRLMPLQIGLPFTLTQWKRLNRWRVAKKQDPMWDYPRVPKPLSGVEEIDALNRAHMGSMVGGSATPGIEVGWKALETTSWGEPFRPAPSLLPGELTFSLSIPWPVDYFECTRQKVTHGGEEVVNDWWPAARPMERVVTGGGSDPSWSRGVVLAGAADVNWWKSRGFFKNDGTDKYPEIPGGA